jgi:hypothetical protein
LRSVVGGSGVGGSGAGLKPGRYIYSPRSWSGGIAFGGGREAVALVAFGHVDGLHESLHQVGDGVGGFGLYIAADNGGDEGCQGGTEIAGGEVVAGEEVGQVFAEGFRGAGASFFLGVVEAEVGMVADARSTATAAIRERK